MDQLRTEARKALQCDAWNRPPFLRAAFTATATNGLPELWQDLSSHDSTVHQDVRKCSPCQNHTSTLIIFIGLRKSLHGLLLRRWLGPAAAE